MLAADRSCTGAVAAGVAAVRVCIWVAGVDGSQRTPSEGKRHAQD